MVKITTAVSASPRYFSCRASAAEREAGRGCASAFVHSGSRSHVTLRTEELLRDN